MRSLDRLLRQESLDPRARTAKQTELAELKQGKTLNQQQELERKYSVRYHKIKFFERIKVERFIKQLKKGAEGRERTAAEEKKLAELQADLQYVLHFPKGEKYVSIIKNADEPSAQAVLDKDRARLRLLVLQQLRDASAVAEADEGQALLSSVTAGLTQTHEAPSSTTPSTEAAADTDSAKAERKALRKAAAAASAAGDNPRETETAKAALPSKQEKRESKEAAAAAAAAAEQGDDDDFFMDVEEGDETEAARAAGVRGGDGGGGSSAGRNGLLDAAQEGESSESEEEEEKEKPIKRQRGGRNGQAAASTHHQGGQQQQRQQGQDRGRMEPHTSAASFLGHKMKSQLSVANTAGVQMDAGAAPAKSRAEGGRKRSKGVKAKK
ncbi:MAG: hypothetical protein WDW38_006835 [Sanguina aurantia]